MSKVYIKEFDLDNVIIDSTNINITRKEYLDKLKGNSKKISYLSWCFLKEIVLENYNIDIDNQKLSYNDYGKPIIQNIFFNISHSNNIVAIAISNSNIGIDIQVVNDKIYALSSYIDKTLDKYELTKRFSAVEAHYKKNGLGIKKSNIKENVIVDYQEVITLNNNDYVLSVSFDDEIIDVIYK